MTNQETLTKAIGLAIKGGWITISDNWYLKGNGVYFKGDVTEIRFTYPDVIYDHDFAKALWGEEMKAEHFTQKAFGLYRPAWQGHLMQMVISEDPIAYLAENLPE